MKAKNVISCRGPQTYSLCSGRKLVLGIALASALILGKTCEAGIGEKYLQICRWALLQAPIAKQIAIPRGLLGYPRPFWVNDPRDLSKASDILADAFQFDPLFLWMAPDPLVRRDLIKTLVRHAFMNGGVMISDPEARGAALWFENNRAPAGSLSILLTGQAFIIARVGLEKTRDLLELNTFLMKTRQQILKDEGAETAIYLSMIGLREGFRGQGRASKMLKPVLDHADDTGQLVLLETHKTENIAIYEHMGFEIRHQEAVPASAPTTTSMVRPPRTRAR
jgi:GNAT superfamily N-acetyltransferase